MIIGQILSNVSVYDIENKYEMYLCKRPIRKVSIIGTIIEKRIKSYKNGEKCKYKPYKLIHSMFSIYDDMCICSRYHQDRRWEWRYRMYQIWDSP
jgi:hypothetical protein